MRSSFVQRLKNQKHDTTTTQESSEKQASHSLKLKSVSLKHPKKQIQEHRADIKKLLSILQETKNPEAELNLPLLTGNSKKKQPKQCPQQLFTHEQSKKQNTSKLNRPSSSYCQRHLKQPIQSPIKRKNHNWLTTLAIKNHQKNQQMLTRQQYVPNLNSSSIFQYEFPAKKKQTPVINAMLPSRLIQVQNPSNISPIKHKKTPTEPRRRGLQNIGNTCYINSILQCLFNLPNFNEYFQREKYLSQNKRQKFNSDRLIVQKYKELYEYVMKPQANQNVQKKSTSSLKLTLSKSCSLFLDWQQEDAHEFMRKLLDSMHQQINRGSPSNPYKLLKTKTTLTYSSISNLAKQYFQYYKEKDDSFIYDSFGGQIYNNIKCVSCKNESVSFENCLDLSIPLVKRKDSLEKLMDEYFSDEKLCDFYKCEYCGQTNKNSVKKTKIWRAPENLILHLKRSQFGNKITTPITFPVDILNIKAYLNNQSDKISQKFSNYTLKAVVCHRGIIQGGHYWCMVKQFGNWFEIDDQQVTQMNSKQVKEMFEINGSAEPYILFYSSVNR